MLGREYILSAEAKFYSWVGAGFYLSFLFTEIIAPWLFRWLVPAYTKLSRAAYLEWNARWTSTIHAIFISICSIGALMFIPQLWNDRLFSTDYFSEALLSVSTGYMIYDLITMPMYLRGFGLVTYIIHHGVVIIGSTIILTQSLGKFYVHWKLLTEISTPFINIRWFLRQSGVPSNHLLVSLSTLFFGITFALVRLVGSIIFWFMYHRSVVTLDTQAKRDLVSSMSIYVYVLGFALDMLNVLWFTVIASLSLRAIKNLQGNLKYRRYQNKPIDHNTWQVITPNNKIIERNLTSNGADVSISVS